MKDVMIDFETLGNGKDKCLCQVGAVYFDNVTGELGKEFKVNIDAQSHIRIGGVIDAPTVNWWLQQSEEARKSILAPGLPIKEAMTQLNDFLSGATRIWSHATFDFVALMDTLRQCEIKPSFGYKAGLDLRTLVYLSGISFDAHNREGVHHDGLDDAKFQVKYAVEALNIVKTNKQVIKFISRFEK